MENEKGISKLAEALAKAQKDFKTIPKNRVAKAGSFSYKYADLADCINAVTPSLSSNGLSISQGVESGGLSSSLLHVSGETLKNWIPLQVPQNAGPQQFGSALSYARRYGLCALLNIVAEEDDDAKVAQESHDKTPEKSISGNLSDKQLKAIHTMSKKAGYDPTAMKAWIKQDFGKESSKDLTWAEASEVIDVLSKELNGGSAQ